MLALGLAIACAAGGAWLLWVDKRRRSSVLWLVLFITSMLAFFQAVKNTPRQELEIALQTLPAETTLSGLESPGNVGQGITYWRQYWKGITEDPKNFLLGHAERPDRNTTPSAHNYYVDLVYNFGAVALLPWLFLLFSSAKLAWIAMRSRTLPTDLLWLFGAVAFFALVDNSLKVGFRQPYPGILMLFLWGVLLTRLTPAAAARRP
jgi:drug/metabolite transporter superfamily protein YnfA